MLNEVGGYIQEQIVDRKMDYTKKYSSFWVSESMKYGNFYKRGIYTLECMCYTRVQILQETIQ